MSQHTFSIANEAGAAFRADVNSALQALASCSRGTAAPATTYAGQVWDDTTANVQKKRNAANSGWIAKMTLDETFVLSRSSNTILGVSDVGKAIVATSTFTQTLTAAATLGDGWYIDYRNDGVGIITLDPNGAETIDGATTLALYPGEGVRVWCNGAAFKTVGRATGWVLISTQTASNSAQIDFTAGISSTYDTYVIEFISVVPVTDSVALWLRASTDGGSSYLATNEYDSQGVVGLSGVTSVASTAGSSARITDTVIGNAANEHASGQILLRAASGAIYKTLVATTSLYNVSTALEVSTFACGIRTTSAVNALRLMMSSGNISSGTFSLYGIRKA